MSLMEIHSVAKKRLSEKFSLNPVRLKHPFPERPPRMLGMIKIDGDVFSSQEFSRIVCLRIDFPFYLKVRSTFIRPRLELDLPVFSSEAVFMGKKRMFIVDIHRAGEDKREEDNEIFDRLIRIRDKYPSLMENTTTTKGEIQSVFSRGVCQVRIPQEKDGEAIKIFQEYLDVFADMIKKAKPLTGERLEKAKQDYEKYLKTVIDHDPGVKGNKIFFGKKGGVERALNIFFEQ